MLYSGGLVEAEVKGKRRLCGFGVVAGNVANSGAKWSGWSVRDDFIEEEKSLHLRVDLLLRQVQGKLGTVAVLHTVVDWAMVKKLVSRLPSKYTTRGVDSD